MGVLNLNAQGHTDAWECLTPYQGPPQSVGVLNPNSRDRPEAWESLTPTQGPTPKYTALAPVLDLTTLLKVITPSQKGP